LSSARNIKGEGHLDDGFAFIHSVTMSQIDDIGCRTNRCAVKQCYAQSNARSSHGVGGLV
jgi:hypothetical protein